MFHNKIPRRASAAAGACALAVTGAVVFVAPAAQATPVEYTTQCQNQLMPDLEIPPSQTKVDFTVSPAKDTYAVGDTVTVTWKWLAYSNVPLNTPVIKKIDKDSVKPTGTINVTGAQTSVLNVEGTRSNPEALLGEPLIITDMTGQFTLTAAGTVNLAPKQYSTWNWLTPTAPNPIETICKPQTTPPVSATLNVQGGNPVEQPTLVAPSTPVKPGDAVALSGTKFKANATPQVSLCKDDLSDCQASRFSGNTLKIDGSGNLSGDATLATAGVPNGAYKVSVSDGTSSATAPLTVQAAPGQRSAVASTDKGPLGTTVHITGTGWKTDTPINMFAVDADGSPLLPVTEVQAAADGSIVGDVRIEDEWAVGIVVREGGNSANGVQLPFQLVPRAAQLSVSTGPVGTVVHVTGTGWTPGSQVKILGYDVDDGMEPSTETVAGPDGSIVGSITVNDEWFAKIVVQEGNNAATGISFPFTVVPGSIANQGTSVTLTAGALSMAQAGDGINFGTATLNGQVQHLNANLNQVTVTDARGGNLGWDLTGTMTDLVAANGTDKIPAGNMSWTPSCAAGTGSLNTVNTGSAGALGLTPSALCAVAPTGSTTGGNFTADAGITLTTPQFAAAGAYTGTLTLTLI